MLKKIFALLAGRFEQRSDAAKKFHHQEDIERDLAHERAQQAQDRRREELKNQMDQRREEPASEEILGPSESREA